MMVKLDFERGTAMAGHPKGLLCRIGVHRFGPVTFTVLPWYFNMNANYSAGWLQHACTSKGCTVKVWWRVAVDAH